ncbi:MAG TPA: branched-chain amino acid ABC transporter permease [Actinomycetes bacterium]|nr:branched-chain amino acid ABC transporter permease [Actinomycetes bacterium]
MNGLTFAGLLFMVGSGFTLIFGLMRIVNLAHGAIYLVGGYVSYSAILATHNLGLGLLAGAVSMAVLGAVLERALLARLRGLPLAELLLTLGIAFVMGDSSLSIWGGDPISIRMPSWFRGSVNIGSITYPVLRLFILGVAILIAAVLFFILNRTRVGAIIRAGVDDREMVSALGINIKRVFTAMFVLGSLLAGLAGTLGGSLLNLYPGADSEILTFALVVVIIGGLGTLQGAIAGSLLVGLIDSYGKAYFPELAYFSLFAPMAIILLWRPQGLFGRRPTT